MPADEVLREIGALDDGDRPTIAGLLLFCKNPQQFLPQAGLVFVKFIGTEPRGEGGLPGYGRREEIGGPLARVIENAWNLVREEMRVGAVVKGLEREELTEYPLFAVREALVNAVCHRDYRLKGRRIEIRMFSDRMEVISPVGCPASSRSIISSKSISRATRVSSPGYFSGVTLKSWALASTA